MDTILPLQRRCARARMKLAIARVFETTPTPRMYVAVIEFAAFFYTRVILCIRRSLRDALAIW